MSAATQQRESESRKKGVVYAQADDGEGSAVAGDPAPSAVVAAAVPVHERVGRVPEPGLDRHQCLPLPAPIPSSSGLNLHRRRRKNDQHRRRRPPRQLQQHRHPRRHHARPAKPQNGTFRSLIALRVPQSHHLSGNRHSQAARATTTSTRSSQLARAQVLPLRVHVTDRAGGEGMEE